MPTLLELVARRKRDRDKADAELRAAIVHAKHVHSWADIAAAAGMSRGGVIHLAKNEKGEK